jgi:hypothetical protein
MISCTISDCARDECRLLIDPSVDKMVRLETYPENAIIFVAPSVGVHLVNPPIRWTYIDLSLP